MKKPLLLFFLILTACSKNPSTQTKPKIENKEYLKSAIIAPLANFGDISYNEVKILTVKVSNNGDEVLAGPASLSSSSDFSIAYQSGCTNLVVGSSCIVKLVVDARNKPSGVKNSNLIIMSGGVEFPVTANILPQPTGTSSGGSVVETMAPSAVLIDFGTLLPKSSVIKSLSIKNTSSISLNKNVTVSPPFIKSYDACSGKNIAPGVSCIIKVSLAHAAVPAGGLVEGTVNYGGLNPEVQLVAQVQTDSQTAQLNSDVDAFFNLIEFSSSLGSASLGTLEQGKSYIHTFTLKNQGAASATVSSVSISSPQFSIVYNNCSGLSLGAGKSCLIKTSVSPTSQVNDLVLSANLGFETRNYPISYTFQPVVNCATDPQPCEISLTDGTELKTYKRIYTKQQLLNSLTFDATLNKYDLLNNIILEADINLAPEVSGQNSLSDRSYLARFVTGHIRGNNKKILNWKGYSPFYMIKYTSKVNDLTLQNFEVAEDLSLTDEGSENCYTNVEPSTGGYCHAEDSCFYWCEDGYYVGTLASINEGLVKNVDVNGATISQPTTSYGSSGGLIGWQSETFDNLNDWNIIGGPGIIDDAQITNVHINSGIWVGGLVGYNSGPINNVSFSGSVYAEHGRAGGITGETLTVDQRIISNATNYGTISGNGVIGGIAGRLISAGALEFVHFNLNNYGTITSTASLTGGLFGRILSNAGAILRVHNSHNYGDVIGTNYIGGIGGEMLGVRGLNLSNEGDISGIDSYRYYIGGIAGYSELSRYEYMENSGNILGDSYLGGIFGLFKGSQLDYAVSSGNVTGTASGIENQGSFVGGLVGYVGGRLAGPVGITHSSSSGTITAVGGVGGAFGWLDEYSTDYLFNVDSSANVVKTGAGIYGGTFAGVLVDDSNGGKTLSGDPNSLTGVPNVVVNIRNWSDLGVLECSATGTLNGISVGSPGHKWIGDYTTSPIPTN